MQKFLSNYKIFYVYLLTKGYKNVTIILNGFINLSPPNIFKKGMTINKHKKVNYKIFTNNYISCYLHWLIDLLVSKMRKR